MTFFLKLSISGNGSGVCATDQHCDLCHQVCSGLCIEKAV